MRRSAITSSVPDDSTIRPQGLDLLSGLDSVHVRSVCSAAVETGVPPDVALRGVTKRFGDLVAVDDIDLEVQPGEFLALLGPSGCGKTTTLRMIAGFDEPTEGEIDIDGALRRRHPADKRDVNTVFQQYALFPHMTVLDNVAYGLKQRRSGRRSATPRRSEALELVRLTGREQAKPAQLSGGMQQRVALARALVMNPKVLLLDEPLGALDLKLRKAMQVELKRIQREIGITFIFVTHDQEEAMAMADRIAVMNAGHIDQLAAPSEIYDRPATPFVADFIGDMNHLEGTLERDGEHLVCAVGDARFGIGRVCARRRPASASASALRPEEVHANTARRGLTGHVPDGDGPRPRPSDRRGARDGRGDRRPSAARGRRGPWRHLPRRQAVARLEPDCRAPAGSRGRRGRPAPAEPARSPGLIHERNHAMPDRPDELSILVPESERARDRSGWSRAGRRCSPAVAPRWPPTWRAAAARPAATPAAVAAEAAARRARRSRRPRPTARSSRATCCSPTGSTTPTRPTTRATRRSTGPKVTVSGFGSNDEILAKLRAGGSNFDVISPTGYAVKTMADLGLIMPLTHELIPNIKNISPAFTQDRLRPGQQSTRCPRTTASRASTGWTDKVSDKPADDQGLLRPAQGRRSSKDMRVNFLEGGTQVMALALAALGYSINTEDAGRDRRGQAAADRRQAEHRHDQLDVHRARQRGEIDFGMGWNGDIRRAIVALAKKDREMVFLVPEGTPSTGSTTGSSRRRPSTRSPRTSGSTTCSTPPPPARR